MARWVLPVPGGPRKTTFSLRGDEVERAQVRDRVAFEGAGVVEVELLDALAGGEPRGADAALTAVALAGGDLALQAGDEELLVRPGLGAGSLGQSGHRLAQRRRLERAGQERHLGADTSRACGLGRRCGPWPSRHRRAVEAERGVVVVQAADLHVRFGHRAQHTDPFAAQQLRRGDVLRVGDGLMPAPRSARDRQQAGRRRTRGRGAGRRSPRCGGRSPQGAPSSRWSPSGCSDHGAAAARCATRSPARPAAG